MENQYYKGTNLITRLLHKRDDISHGALSIVLCTTRQTPELDHTRTGDIESVHSLTYWCICNGECGRAPTCVAHYFVRDNFDWLCEPVDFIPNKSHMIVTNRHNTHQQSWLGFWERKYQLSFYAQTIGVQVKSSWVWIMNLVTNVACYSVCQYQ